ncbi:MAG: exodeoxyribonuclease VII small subunit [Pseudomonadota bacterium]
MARKPTTEAQLPADFETALEELEALVERLERGDLQLAEALHSFERGVQLTRHCQNALTAAQQKVEILLKEGAAAQVRDFDQGSEDRDVE